MYFYKLKTSENVIVSLQYGMLQEYFHSVLQTHHSGGTSGWRELVITVVGLAGVVVVAVGPVSVGCLLLHLWLQSSWWSLVITIPGLHPGGSCIIWCLLTHLGVWAYATDCFGCIECSRTQQASEK